MKRKLLKEKKKEDNRIFMFLTEELYFNVIKKCKYIIATRTLIAD